MWRSAPTLADTDALATRRESAAALRAEASNPDRISDHISSVGVANPHSMEVTLRDLKYAAMGVLRDTWDACRDMDAWWRSALTAALLVTAVGAVVAAEMRVRRFVPVKGD